MPDPLLPFGEYRPDVSDYEGIASQAVTNVVARGDGYGPFQDFRAFTQTLAGPCRGFFAARKSDGSIVIFAATSTNIYELNNSTFGWTNVSLSGGPYSALSSGANWQFAQFGSLVFATQANVVLQVFTLGSSSAFANNSDSPPQAAYIAVVGQFLVLSGLNSTPYRIQWSGLGDTTNWTAGVNQSDFQDFADGGLVRQVAGGEYGVIFQDTTIRQMTYAPGSAYIFQITRVCEDQGLFAPYAVARAGANIIFPSAQGFQLLQPGLLPEPIGKERVDRSFFAEVDTSNPQLIIAANDPSNPRVFFAFKSNNGSTGLFDTILVYDYVLDRWVGLSISGQYLATLAKPGLTLENLDVAATTTIAITGAANNGSGLIRLTVATENLPVMVPAVDGASQPTVLTTGMIVDVWNVGGTTEANAEGWVITVIDSSHIDLQGSAFVNAYTSGGVVAGPIDAMQVSLDNFPSIAGEPELGAFNSANALGFFNGPNLQATLESAEKGDLGTRIFVSGFRPVTDAQTVFGSLSTRENLQATRVYTAENPINSQGLIPMRASTRYSRGKIRIPYGTTWTFAMGVEPETITDGAR